MAETDLSTGTVTQAGSVVTVLGAYPGQTLLVDGNFVAFPATGCGASVFSGGPSALDHGFCSAVVTLANVSTNRSHAGVCVLMDSDVLAPGGGAQGYGFAIDKVDDFLMLRLVQITNGIDPSPHANDHSGSSYEVLSEQINAPFSPDFPLTLRLEWYSNPDQLKGVYLKALVGDDQTVFAELVYTGAIAYIPSMTATRNGVFAGYFPGPMSAYFSDVNIGQAS